MAQHWLSARRLHGRDECVWCDAQGQVKAALPLPARGHSFAIDATHHRAVVFGRQPGFFAYAFALDGSGALQPGTLPLPLPLPLPNGHHFYGHGVFAPDGHTLYATENDYARARGVIGVYDARPGRGFARIGGFDSGGMGPHEIVLMPDGQTLCVANGGMQTHPDFGKTILNRATMRPSLAYLNRHDGRVLAVHTLQAALTGPQAVVPLGADAWRHLSIRHLAVDGLGQVWAGCQYVNADGQRPPLVWRHGCHPCGHDLQAVACPPEAQRAMRNYVGSVAVNAAGTVIAASSPVGGQVLFWEVGVSGQPSGHARFLQAFELPDVCGIAPWGAEGFLLSSGHGALVQYEPLGWAQTSRPSARSQTPPPVLPVAWDNHLRRI